MSIFQDNIDVLRSEATTPVARVAQENAFSYLDEQFRPRLMAVSSRYLGSTALAEDTVQQVMLESWLNRKKLPTDADEVSDILRRRLAWRNSNTKRDLSQQPMLVPFDKSLELPGGALEGAVNPVGNLEARTDFIGKLQSIQGLANSQHQILALAVSGATGDELASHFGISIKNAHARLRGARNAAQKAYNDGQSPEFNASAEIDYGKEFLETHYRRLMPTIGQRAIAGTHLTNLRLKVGSRRDKLATVEAVAISVLEHCSKETTASVEDISQEARRSQTSVLNALKELKRFQFVGLDSVQSGGRPKHNYFPTKLLIGAVSSDPALLQRLGQCLSGAHLA